MYQNQNVSLYHYMDGSSVHPPESLSSNCLLCTLECTSSRVIVAVLGPLCEAGNVDIAMEDAAERPGWREVTVHY